MHAACTLLVAPSQSDLANMHTFNKHNPSKKKGARVSVSGDGCKYMVPDSTSGVSFVSPGAALLPTKDKAATCPVSKKDRKRKSSESRMSIKELPMIDRLKLLSKETKHATTPPRTDSLLQLLIQGLHNQDSKLLNSVVDKGDEELIDTTIHGLPVEGIVPLLHELQKFIQGRGMVGHSHAKWMRSILQHHAAYLFTPETFRSRDYSLPLAIIVNSTVWSAAAAHCPLRKMEQWATKSKKTIKDYRAPSGQWVTINKTRPTAGAAKPAIPVLINLTRLVYPELMANSHCQRILTDVHAMLEVRTKHYHPLMQLKGRLDLITKQIKAKPDDVQDAILNKEALLVYQDDSSDEVSYITDELLLPTSDTWPMDENDSDPSDDDDDEYDNSNSEEDLVNENGESDCDQDSMDNSN